MISSYLCLAVCLVICTKLMFFMNTPRIHAPLTYNICALAVTVYAGARSIRLLSTLNHPTSIIELGFNVVLLGVVLTMSTRLHRQFKNRWKNQ